MLALQKPLLLLNIGVILPILFRVNSIFCIAEASHESHFIISLKWQLSEQKKPTAECVKISNRPRLFCANDAHAGYYWKRH